MVIGKENARQAVSQDTPGLSDLFKAQIRLIALQRNINALALQHRDMQQELAKAEAEFHALRERVQQETGLVYNDQTLTLEPKSKGTGGDRWPPLPTSTATAASTCWSISARETSNSPPPPPKPS